MAPYSHSSFVETLDEDIVVERLIQTIHFAKNCGATVCCRCQPCLGKKEFLVEYPLESRLCWMDVGMWIASDV